MIGIPLLSKERYEKAILRVTSIATLETAGSSDEKDTGNDHQIAIELQTSATAVRTKRVRSKRQREPPSFDARIHPERETVVVDTPTTVMINPTTTPAFTYLELFAGMGGFAVALNRLGGECVMASEIDESCRKNYQANFPKVPLRGDIYQISNDQLPPSFDLLVGGFPCQPFSAMGAQPGLDDPKNGRLFFEIVRILKHCQPQAFLLENVPGLLGMNDGTTFATIINALEASGYDVYHEVYDARGLTASTRKRLYIVGFIRQPQDNYSSIQFSSQTNFEFPFAPDLGLRAMDVIDYHYPANEKMFSTTTLTVPDALLRLTDRQMERLLDSKYWRPAHLAWPNSTCNTLVSHYGKNVVRGHCQLVPASAYNVQRNPRRFTPRECCRIMGFPESYILWPQETISDKIQLRELYHMIGNAVCPPVIAVLAGAILDRCKGISAPRNIHHLAGKQLITTTSWVQWGRATAVRLAHDATLTHSAATSQAS
jgi:DNA (cytosine-5)-methyltransferase 1